MKVFVTGASGYIGGSIAAGLIREGHEVLGLVRSEERAAQVREHGIEPVLGSLEDTEVLTDAAQSADAVVNAADAAHRGAAETLLSALAGSNKPLVQTNGTSIIADLSLGKGGGKIYDEETPFEPLPGRVERVAINTLVLEGAANGVRSVVICPPLIYGKGGGVNPNSIQVPWLVALAKKRGCASHIGPGENVWSNVHIEDLVDLYLLLLRDAPAGSFYFAENGENSFREVCEAINAALGMEGPTQEISIEDASAEWGEAAANYTMGSNSRVRAVRARKELGWAPHRRSLLEDIKVTCR